MPDSQEGKDSRIRASKQLDVESKQVELEREALPKKNIENIDEQPETWRDRILASANRKGVPLATIFVTVLTVIVLIDINVLLVVLLWVLRTIVLYTLVALFAAILMTPPTRFLQRRGLPHGVAATLVFIIVLLTLVGIISLFTTPLISNAGHFQSAIKNLVNQSSHGKGPVGHLVFQLHLQQYLANGASKLTGELRNSLRPATAFAVGAEAVSTVLSLVTISVLSLFALIEAPSIWRGFLSFFSPETAARLQRVYEETSRSVGGYLLGNVLTSIIAGFVAFVTLSLLGVPFALLLGTWVAIVDLLPLVGGLLAGLPVVLIALLHSLPAGIVMLIVFIVYQQIENHALNPLILSRTVRLNPLWVLLAVLIGATLGDRVGSGLGAFIGALTGIPIGGAIQIVVGELRRGPSITKGSPP